MPIKKKENSIKIPKDKPPVEKEAVPYIRAVGRRKTASARVRIFPGGKGEVLINAKKLKEYFPYQLYADKIELPFKVTGWENKFDVTVKVEGGGVNAQAEAIRHGIARALVKYEPGLKATLRAAGFMTRDPRAKERKKPGLKRARRAPQWSKR